MIYLVSRLFIVNKLGIYAYMRHGTLENVHNICNHWSVKLIFYDLNSFHWLSDALYDPPRYSYIKYGPEYYLNEGRKHP